MNIKNVMVIGAGQMGSGIAQVVGGAGFNVILNDLEDTAIDRGLATINKFLTRAVDRERITDEEKEMTLNNITRSTSLNDAKDVDLVIEAAIENMDVKRSEERREWKRI